MTKTTMASTSTTLLFFLLAGHLAAAANNNNIIRLPSNGAAAHDELEEEEEEEGKAPWGECCDDPERSPLAIFPPLYSCNDKVKQCAAACKDCVEAPGGGGLYVCNDAYQTTHPGPFCTPRPWGDCCDDAFCTRSRIPTCRCVDDVEKCAAACKDCRPVYSSETTPRYVCQDRFTGQPGPRCTPDEHK